MTVRSTISHVDPGGSCHSSGVVGVTPSGNVCLKTIGALIGAFPTLEIEQYQIGICPGLHRLRGLHVQVEHRSRRRGGRRGECGARHAEDQSGEQASHTGHRRPPPHRMPPWPWRPRVARCLPFLCLPSRPCRAYASGFFFLCFGAGLPGPAKRGVAGESSLGSSGIGPRQASPTHGVGGAGGSGYPPCTRAT